MIDSALPNPSQLEWIALAASSAADEQQALPETPSPVGRLEDARVMIVDDEPINIKAVRKHLANAGYRHFVETTRAGQVHDVIQQSEPDVVLLDIEMPEKSGLEVLSEIRSDSRFSHVPVIILTASEDRQTMLDALERGATDFLTKPVEPLELLPRVRNSLVVKSHHDHLRDYARRLQQEVHRRTAELAASRLELIHCLARAAEYRDNDTGRHVIRVGRYVGIIARELGLDEPTVELLEHAAPLHDTGKIGVPDAILLKPGKLDEDEFGVMQKHCTFGKRTFELMSPEESRLIRTHTRVGENLMTLGNSPILAVAARIALTHHEKWDGSGYPLGLSGEDIPLEGRITAVADVFDALSSARPYKPPFPLEKCFQIMEDGRGEHFDPCVLDAFFARRAEVVQVRISFADIDTVEHPGTTD
ncbi:MAG: HD domain-containing phosphohydrolase [Planctomycetota bacterium]